MKVLSKVFIAFAILLSDVMCAVVGYSYSDLLWAGEYAGTSFPAYVAFFYAIPFLVGIVVCVALAWVFHHGLLVTEVRAQKGENSI